MLPKARLILADPAVRLSNKELAKLSIEDRLVYWITVTCGSSKQEGECWLGTGRDKDGYSLITISNKSYKAHRLFYEVFKGVRIPEGLVLDHLCENKACVNPDPLEAVSHRENILRGNKTPGHLNSKKEKCPKGHLYDSVEYEAGKVRRRKCSVCKKERFRNYYLQKKAGSNIEPQ